MLTTAILTLSRGKERGDQGPLEPRPGVITDACYTFVDNENKFLAVIAADVCRLRLGT